jgi:methionyl-tRNA formyltransferase
MKIVLWCGSEPNQQALANKIHRNFPLTGIVMEKKTSATKLTLKKVFEKAIEKMLIPSLDHAWKNLLQAYKNEFPDFPPAEKITVANINSDETFQFTRNLQPDLILVSGTHLIKEKLLSLNPRTGMLNLHTGLSPYIKGGPNCTNWCLATRQFHLIGNTVMWLNKGIDSGNILVSECTPLTGEESLSALHLKVMNHAHDLYLRALQFIAEGKHQSIPQKEIAAGRTFFSREWTLKQKINAVRNFKTFREYFKSGSAERERKKVQCITLIR